MDDPIDSYYEELITNLDAIVGPDDLSFRDEQKTLSIDTSIITKAGTRRCGTDLIKTPKFNQSWPCVITNSTASHTINSSGEDTDAGKKSIQYITHQELYTLHCRRSNVLVASDGINKYVSEVTGSLENIKAYARCSFNDDKDQEMAFILTSSAFVMSLHEICNSNNRKRTRDTNYRDILRLHKGKTQFIAFLSGAGGTGKSKVIHTVKEYSKKLCDSLNIEFTARTIVVTALTGAAAVSINGETTSKACGLNAKCVCPDDEWDGTIMLIVDEVSFARKSEIETLNKNLRIKRDKCHGTLFGNLHVLFAGDFMQLKPIGAIPLYLCVDFKLWWKDVHTFLELKTNHRFEKDPEHGRMLDRFRAIGFTEKDVETYNSRVVCKENNLTEDDLPPNIVIAVKNNIDRNAIHDAMFAAHLQETHSKDPSLVPPMHTICIMASDFSWWVASGEYTPMSSFGRDIIYATCGDDHIRSGSGGSGKKIGSKCVDPMLKLYAGCPVMVTENIDVKKCIANGAMCKFKGLTLKDGISLADLKIIIVDEFHVRCAEVSQVESIQLELDENLPQENGSPRVINLVAKEYYAKVKYPITFQSSIRHNTQRRHKRIKLTQFSINIAHARTVHKLQSRSVENILISSWDYTGNWVYVVLSRCRTMNGIFIRHKLNRSRLNGPDPKCTQFYDHFRQHKSPATLEERIYL
jgi:hypothetical protein